MNAAAEVQDTWLDVAGKTQPRLEPSQSWESWALHVEEITGYSARAWLDAGYTAWENGQSAHDFAHAWMLFSPNDPEVDDAPRPFFAPNDPSSPLLAISALLGAALVVAAFVTGLLLWGRA